MTVDIGEGASCHVGYKSCFYRSITLGKINDTSKSRIKFQRKRRKDLIQKVYKNQPNPTKL